MILGFTGTRNLLEWHQRSRIDGILSKLKEDATCIVTGACTGVDAYVAHWFERNAPDIRQVIYIPSKREMIDQTIYTIPTTIAMRIQMPCVGDERTDKAASFRRRNQAIVDHAERMIAFWNGTRGGTTMTIKIARQAGKIVESDIHRI
jgi:hypothetical protein